MAIAIIDPGHGGTRTVGGSSPNNAKGPTGLLEKDVNLDLARRVCKALGGSAVVARMTRDTDKNLGLQARAEVARRDGADAFISIHLNGFNGSAQGTETWHHNSASGDSKALAALVQTAVCEATGLRDRGVKSGSFGVLRPWDHATATAACLVEVSFMDVAAEEARLRTDAYKDKIATALAGAITGWLVADSRMTRPELLPAEATAIPEDGYEASRLDDALTSERAYRDAQPAASVASGAQDDDMSFSIDFFGDPRDHEIHGAAGGRKGWICKTASKSFKR